MLILPAIDLLSGNAVRLKQGAENTAKVYSHHPPEIATKWQEAGAQYIHMVNLDGAFGRAQKNSDVIKQIVQTVSIPVELGGGIRSLQDVRSWLQIGVTRVILGTIAITEPDIVETAIAEFGPEAIVIGIDGRDNKVAIRGWEEQTETSVVQLAQQMKSRGAKRIIYTDVYRDGESVGPNIKNTDNLARESDLKVIASGGFSRMSHFDELEALNNPNIEGAIVGTALYEGELDLQELTRRFRV